MSRSDHFDLKSHSIDTLSSYFQLTEHSLPRPSNLSIPENRYIEYIQGFTCKICQENKPDVFSVSKCHHIYCFGCISDYITLRIQEAQVSKIPCPDHECENEITEAEIKNLISDINYEKYQIFKRNNELSNNPFVRWCPQPDCTGFDLGNISKDHLTCPVCSFEYCYYCGEPWHTANKCKQKYDRDLDDWGKKNNLRFCTNCRIKVEKTMGCDHMVCTRCGFQWCWLCGEQYNHDHMSTCGVYELVKWDKSLFRIFQLILSPIILAILPIYIIIGFVYQTDAGFSNDAKFLFKFFKKRVFVYIFVIFFGILSLPAYLAFGPFVAGTIIAFKFFCFIGLNKRALNFASFIFGCLIGPLVPSVALVVVLGMMIYGIVFLVIKIVICFIRLFNPNFMTVYTKYRPLYK